MRWTGRRLMSIPERNSAWEEQAVPAEILILSFGPVKSNQDVRGKAWPLRSNYVPTFTLRAHLPFTIPIFLMRATNVVGLIPSRSAAPPFP